MTDTRENTGTPSLAGMSRDEIVSLMSRQLDVAYGNLDRLVAEARHEQAGLDYLETVLATPVEPDSYAMPAAPAANGHDAREATGSGLARALETLHSIERRIDGLQKVVDRIDRHRDGIATLAGHVKEIHAAAGGQAESLNALRQDLAGIADGLRGAVFAAGDKVAPAVGETVRSLFGGMVTEVVSVLREWGEQNPDKLPDVGLEGEDPADSPAAEEAGMRRLQRPDAPVNLYGRMIDPARLAEADEVVEAAKAAKAAGATRPVTPGFRLPNRGWKRALFMAVLQWQDGGSEPDSEVVRTLADVDMGGATEEEVQSPEPEASGDARPPMPVGGTREMSDILVAFIREKGGSVTTRQVREMLTERYSPTRSVSYAYYLLNTSKEVRKEAGVWVVN